MMFAAALAAVAAAATQGTPIPAPLPLFPADNWWNLDVSAAPVDTGSSNYIAFINNGSTRQMHPDFGGDVSSGSVKIYGFPYAVVDSTTPLKAVTFQYADESDGVDHTTGASLPFYPIPDEAIAQAHWIESGEPGNVDLRSSSDRHYVYPASHRAGSQTGALPMGARLRMKAARDISGFRPEIQKIFRAMKRYGLLVADNGSDLYVSGAYDARWDNGTLNPAFHSMTANDLEVIQLGYRPAATPPAPPTNLRVLAR
jgi:hypothetical protein